MALKDIDANEEYPYVFLVTQSIQQKVPDSASDPAYYPLSLILKYYKIVDSKMVIDPARQVTIDIDDFTQLALSDMASGDYTHLNTLNAQQLSVKRLIEAQTGKTFEVI